MIGLADRMQAPHVRIRERQRPAVIIIHATPPKPRMGQPCNGCGFCCAVEPCFLAVKYLDCHTGPCVALEVEDGRTYCGLVRHPARHLVGVEDADHVPPEVTARVAASFAYVLGLGHGCDALDGT